MSEPNSADFALLKIKTAVGPPAVYNVLCGLDSVSISRDVQTTESFRRDCAKPNRPANRKLKVDGKTWSISGSGLDNVDMETTLSAALGIRKDYIVELYKDDDTDTGALMGSYEGTAIMTTRNQGWSQDADSTAEVTLTGEGDLTWTPAP